MIFIGLTYQWCQKCTMFLFYTLMCRNYQIGQRKPCWSRIGIFLNLSENSFRRLSVWPSKITSNRNHFAYKVIKNFHTFRLSPRSAQSEFVCGLQTRFTEDLKLVTGIWRKSESHYKWRKSRSWKTPSTTNFPPPKQPSWGGEPPQLHPHHQGEPPPPPRAAAPGAAAADRPHVGAAASHAIITSPPRRHHVIITPPRRLLHGPPPSRRGRCGLPRITVSTPGCTSPSTSSSPWPCVSSSPSGLRAHSGSYVVYLSLMVWSYCDYEHCNLVESIDVFPSLWYATQVFCHCKLRSHVKHVIKVTVWVMCMIPLIF